MNMERSTLERKDRAELAAVAGALGIKVPSRAKKADIVSLILEGVSEPGAATLSAADESPVVEESSSPSASSDAGSSEAPAADDAGAAPAVESAATAAPAASGGSTPSVRSSIPAPPVLAEADVRRRDAVASNPQPRRNAPAGRAGASRDTAAANDTVNGNDTANGNDSANGNARSDEGGSDANLIEDHGVANGNRTGNGNGNGNGNGSNVGPGGGQPNDVDLDGDGEGGGRNRRRRRRGRDRSDADISNGGMEGEGEPLEVSGLLDLREDGYGFLRVNGFLPGRDDVYVSVKQCRQLGLRKGDHLTGLARPAGHKEKNPALTRVETVNAMDPEAARHRPRFDDLTPLFPDEKLNLEGGTIVGDMTGRIIDLIAPIGKGQRGLIVSPPKAGKTTIMKTIAQAIERNHPDVHLIVLLIDERPEEVTDFRRSLKTGEVVASTFDRPAEEHTAVAELTIEHAKRLVEYGNDVVVMLDGITRLARAYNLAAPAGGRSMSGGLDSTALYPPKKFFGAARNAEEGGSLTILATALVETGSVMDTVIFEEFKGTGNMELGLDRYAAEKRVFPAIAVDASSTRHEELLFERKQVTHVHKLRRVLGAVSGDGNSTAALEMLVDRMGQFRTNDEFLAEVAKAPSA